MSLRREGLNEIISLEETHHKSEFWKMTHKYVIERGGKVRGSEIEKLRKAVPGIEVIFSNEYFHLDSPVASFGISSVKTAPGPSSPSARLPPILAARARETARPIPVPDTPSVSLLLIL